MTHGMDLILTLTGGLAAALVCGFASQYLRLSPIVGYLLAGIVIGPFTPGFVAHGVIAKQFAELGVILLMFGVGLHLNLKELLAVRRVAVPGALGAIAIATIAGSALILNLTDWSLVAAVVYGLSISIASTVVVLRVLADQDNLHTLTGHVAVGWLLVEDLLTVVVLVLLPVLVGHHGHAGPGAIAASVGMALAKIAVLVAFTLVVGKKLIPKILGYVARLRSRELFTLTVLVLALGIAVGSAEFFGVSMALGAFLAGLIVGQSEFSTRAASEALPMRDAFAVLFFVSMGMLLDPSRLAPNAGLIATTLVVVVVAKPLVAFLMILWLRRGPKMALEVAASLAQIGEFSLIVAGLGYTLHVLPQRAIQILVATSIVSITINPLLSRLTGPVAGWFSSRGRSRATGPEPSGGLSDPEHRAIVVGYGPIGCTLARLLKENGLEPTIIELNHDTVNRLARDGLTAIYGDATQREVLERAGVRTAGSLVFAASGSPKGVVKQARDLNPQLLVLTRATYLREVPALRGAGAEVVVSAEIEVALAMTEHLLTRLGATADQLDRARDRVRSDLQT